MFGLQSVSFQQLKPLRRAYLKTITAPLDGMWEDAFFPVAAHYAVLSDGRTVGYCSVNQENALLGFQSVRDDAASAAFVYCLRKFQIKTAYVSTAEPIYHSLCMDHQTSVRVNAIMYEDGGHGAEPPVFPGDTHYRLVEQSDFGIAIDFGLRSIGDVREWLNGYYTERIAKQELFGLWNGNELQAAGELRLSAIQEGVADVGMVVSPAVRRKGIATEILKRLLADGRDHGLRLICSTEKSNIGAQKAIVQAGFKSSHRILEVAFSNS
jgi:GNAT superfamily N-acetyltransferase